MTCKRVQKTLKISSSVNNLYSTDFVFLKLFMKASVECKYLKQSGHLFIGLKGETRIEGITHKFYSRTAFDANVQLSTPYLSLMLTLSKMYIPAKYEKGLEYF